MRRGHTQKENYGLVEYIRREIPEIALRTTLIAGHPGESKKDFNELKKFVETIQFERLGVFTYSAEEDTLAAKIYKDTIPEKIKKERADELMAIQQDISLKKNQRMIGNILKVLIDSREGEFFAGRTESDSPEIDNNVLLGRKETAPVIGNFYKVRITGAEEFDLYGEIADD